VTVKERATCEKCGSRAFKEKEWDTPEEFVKHGVPDTFFTWQCARCRYITEERPAINSIIMRGSLYLH
jgi:predicted nucleic-acid-binding Zn-ribbon protein